MGNRVIKFNIWDEHNKVWLNPKDFTIGCNNGVVKNKFSAGVIGGVLLVQFTGRLDKNGKEIYEGDILKKCFGSTNPLIVVAYDENRACFINNDGYNAQLFIEPIDQCEIIGNIYENPELLKP